MTLLVPRLAEMPSQKTHENDNHFDHLSKVYVLQSRILRERRLLPASGVGYDSHDLLRYLLLLVRLLLRRLLPLPVRLLRLRPLL